MSMHMSIIIRASMYMYWPELLFRVRVPRTITINIRLWQSIVVGLCFIL